VVKKLEDLLSWQRALGSRRVKHAYTDIDLECQRDYDKEMRVHMEDDVYWKRS
jgi:hypothetical protein